MFDKKKYPLLASITNVLAFNKNPLLGREQTLEDIMAALNKSEMSNVLLIAEAGGGKTATVQEFAKRYQKYYTVIETSIAQLEKDGKEYMAKNFKELFKELIDYHKNGESKKELVLFIDEFHQFPLASTSAVEALKPEFARSGQLGIHVVGATTYEEYIKYIEPNMALTERFQLLNLPIANDALTFRILKSRMAKQNVIKETPYTDKILRDIIYDTDTYIKSKVQPRKSTDILDQMVSYVKASSRGMTLNKYEFNEALLAKVFKSNTNVQVNLTRDATHYEELINNQVYNQQMAVHAILKNAYSAILGITDDKKPRGVFLLVGSTGVGKTALVKAFTKVMFGQDATPNVFDMAEYASPDDIRRFQLDFTDAALSASTPVFLLDEIEKADKGIGKLLFSVTDEARLHDRYGHEVNFSNAFIMLTTNSGDSVFNNMSGQGYTAAQMETELKTYSKLIHETLMNDPIFPAPLLGRITAFVPFAPPSQDSNELIAYRELGNSSRRFLNKQDVALHYDFDNIIRYLTKEKLDNDSNQGGARQLINLVAQDVAGEAAKYVVFNPNVKDLYITTSGKAKTLDKFQLASEEKIRVVDYNNPPEELRETVNKDHIETYRETVEETKPYVAQHLKFYKKLGIRVSADSKSLFKGLTRYHNIYDPESAVDLFFQDADSIAAGGAKQMHLVVNGNTVSVK